MTSTQSGVLAHALGAGAIVAGRELEGVGETLREAGAIVDGDPERLLLRIRDVVLDEDLRDATEKKALEYAATHSWRRQAGRHHQLAESVANPVEAKTTPSSLRVVDAAVRPLPRPMTTTLPSQTGGTN